MALRHGAPVAPAWVILIEAAAEWNRPPWEIAGSNQFLWWKRWQAYREARNKIERERANEAKRKRN